MSTSTSQHQQGFESSIERSSTRSSNPQIECHAETLGIDDIMQPPTPNNATLSNAAYSAHISRASPNAESRFVPQPSMIHQYVDVGPPGSYRTGVVAAFGDHQSNEAPYDVGFSQPHTLYRSSEQPAYATSSVAVWSTPNNREVPVWEGESNVGGDFLSQQATALGQNMDVSIASLEPSELNPRLAQLHYSQQSLSNTNADFSMWQPSICIDSFPPLYDPMEESVEPWSNVNMRTNAQHIMPPNYGALEHDAASDSSLFASLNQTHGGYEYLPLNHNPSGAQAKFYLDVDEAVARQSISQTHGGGYPEPMEHTPQQTTSLPYTSGSGLPEHTVGFWVRRDMPSMTTNVDANHNGRDTLVGMPQRDYLEAPRSRPPYSDESVSISAMSRASSSLPTVLLCSEAGCDVTFYGKYRRGNLARHKRSFHRRVPSEYPCDAHGCPHVYKRTDSRLNHYRKHHPHLSRGPAKPRGPQGSDRADP